MSIIVLKKHFSLENLGQEIFILFYVNKITWTYQIDIYDNFSRKTRSNSCISKKNVAKWMLHNMMLGKILVTLTQSVSVCWPTVGAWCVGLWLNYIGPITVKRQLNKRWLVANSANHYTTMGQNWLQGFPIRFFCLP